MAAFRGLGWENYRKAESGAIVVKLRTCGPLELDIAGRLLEV
jgi:hypothetical protein